LVPHGQFDMVKSGGVFDLTFLDSRDENLAFYIAMSLICCMLSATVSGLTMAYMSLDTTKLRMLQRTGTVAEKRQVAVVLPLLADIHRLLVTLLLANTLSNEALPIFLDSLMPSWLALVLSVSAVTIFCEILPQSLTSSGKHKLFIATACAPIMRSLLVLFYPIAWPGARLLDRIIPDETREKDPNALLLFTKEELLAMVDILRESEHASIIAAEGHSFSTPSPPRTSFAGNSMVSDHSFSAQPESSRLSFAVPESKGPVLPRSNSSGSMGSSSIGGGDIIPNPMLAGRFSTEEAQL